MCVANNATPAVDGDAGLSFEGARQEDIKRRQKAILDKTDKSLLVPDKGDIAIRDAKTGKVRRARGGSLRSSFFDDIAWTQPRPGESMLMGDGRAW